MKVNYIKTKNNILYHKQIEYKNDKVFMRLKIREFIGVIRTPLQ